MEPAAIVTPGLTSTRVPSASKACGDGEGLETQADAADDVPPF